MAEFDYSYSCWTWDRLAIGPTPESFPPLFLFQRWDSMGAVAVSYKPRRGKPATTAAIAISHVEVCRPEGIQRSI